MPHLVQLFLLGGEFHVFSFAANLGVDLTFAGHTGDFIHTVLGLFFVLFCFLLVSLFVCFSLLLLLLFLVLFVCF